MTMADIVAVMNRGLIEQMGPPEELYELPRTVFVANFLGQSNLFTGPVAGTTADSISVDIAGVKVVIPKKRAARHTGTVTVGVRPEKMTLHTSKPKVDAANNVLGPGRVVDVSFTGVSTQYLVAIPGVGSVTVFSQNLGFGPTAHEGDEVWVSWHVEHGFGLEDDPEDGPRFAGDADTQMLAAQSKRELQAELKSEGV